MVVVVVREKERERARFGMNRIYICVCVRCVSEIGAVLVVLPYTHTNTFVYIVCMCIILCRTWAKGIHRVERRTNNSVSVERVFKESSRKHHTYDIFTSNTQIRLHYILQVYLWHIPQQWRTRSSMTERIRNQYRCDLRRRRPAGSYRAKRFSPETL